MKCHIKTSRIIAPPALGFIFSSIPLPKQTCTGCAHLQRIMNLPEWALSKNCPCLECLSQRVLIYADITGTLGTFSNQLEYWTDGPIPDFADDDWFDPHKLTILADEDLNH